MKHDSVSTQFVVSHFNEDGIAVLDRQNMSFGQQLEMNNDDDLFASLLFGTYLVSDNCNKLSDFLSSKGKEHALEMSYGWQTRDHPENEVHELFWLF